MRKIFIVAILLASPLPALAVTKIEIVARLSDYDLTQGGGAPSGNEMRATVASESETLLDRYSKAYRYNKEFNEQTRKPTVRRIAYLGARIFIYVREQDGTIYYLGRIELCKREDPTNKFSEITKSTSSFQGHMASGNTVVIDARAPGENRAKVEITLTKQ